MYFGGLNSHLNYTEGDGYSANSFTYGHYQVFIDLKASILQSYIHT